MSTSSKIDIGKVFSFIFSYLNKVVIAHPAHFLAISAHLSPVKLTLYKDYTYEIKSV